jgi:regulator of sigma D
MTSATQAKPERRQQARALIDELVTERRQVWSLYFRVAELKPFASCEQLTTAVNEFAQLLIDYISLGEFGIYERVLQGKERRQNMLKAAEELYPEYSGTTQIAVAFNDKYENPENNDKINELEKDLSALGEKLAKRIEIEDKLCGMILR